jgi:hypothetical protein
LVFQSLPVQHEDEVAEFRYHVHMLQGLLTMRIARRAFPLGWPSDPPLSLVGQVADSEGATHG